MSFSRSADLSQSFENTPLTSIQYFTSLRLARVDWTSAENRFQRAFYITEKDATGREIRRVPTVYSLWQWIVDFLTADFPPRATFITGMILGIRLG